MPSSSLSELPAIHETLSIAFFFVDSLGAFKAINFKAHELNVQDISHGDIGCIHSNDTILIFSNSGNTSELLTNINHIKSKSDRIIGIFSNETGKLCPYCLDIIILPKVKENDNQINLFPTNSVISFMSFTVSVFKKIIEHNEERYLRIYKENHYNGNIGVLTHTKVKDRMNELKNVPTVEIGESFSKILLKMTQYSTGCSLVFNNERVLLGIITDGDIRRLYSNDCELMLKTLDENIITVNPVTVTPMMTLYDVQNMTRKKKLMPVMDGNQCIGLLDLEKI